MKTTAGPSRRKGTPGGEPVAPEPGRPTGRLDWPQRPEFGAPGQQRDRYRMVERRCAPHSYVPYGEIAGMRNWGAPRAPTFSWRPPEIAGGGSRPPEGAGGSQPTKSFAFRGKRQRSWIPRPASESAGLFPIVEGAAPRPGAANVCVRALGVIEGRHFRRISPDSSAFDDAGGSGGRRLRRNPPQTSAFDGRCDADADICVAPVRAAERPVSDRAIGPGGGGVLARGRGVKSWSGAARRTHTSLLARSQECVTGARLARQPSHGGRWRSREGARDRRREPGGASRRRSSRSAENASARGCPVRPASQPACSPSLRAPHPVLAPQMSASVHSV